MAVITIYFNPDTSPELKKLIDDLKQNGTLSSFGRAALLEKSQSDDKLLNQVKTIEHQVTDLDDKLNQVLNLLNNGIQVNPSTKEKPLTATSEEPIETMGFVDFTI